MSSFASIIIDWLLPSRPNTTSSVCHGTARQIARRLVMALDLNDPFYVSVYERHLMMVVQALRSNGLPVTHQAVIRYTHIRDLQGLCEGLRSSNETWLDDYLVDLQRPMPEVIAGMREYLAARLGVTNAPRPRFTFTYAVGVVISCLFDVLLTVCFVLAWVATIVLYAIVFWVAFDRLGLRSLSAAQCLGLGLLVVFLFNELTGRTDALAKCVVSRITSRL